MSNQSEQLPWRKEHEFDQEGVRTLLEEQFPDLAPDSLHLIGEGWDSEAYLVNDEVIFRLPKRAEVVAWQECERCFLARFADRLPLETPRMEWIGTPSDRYPFPFAGYRRLPGVPAIECLDIWNELDHETIARQIGEFLSALHAINVEEAKKCGLKETGEEDWMGDRFWMRREVHFHNLQQSSTDLAQRLDHWFNTTSPSHIPFVPSVPLHADLGPEHLMIDPVTGRLCGVIDWGDICLGPVAGDLVGCVVWSGEDFLHRVLEHYSGDVDRGILPWLIERSLLVALSHIDYGVRAKRSEYLRLGLHTLDCVLPHTTSLA